METKKLATELTPKIKEWIVRTFNCESYNLLEEGYIFNFPNYNNYEGFKSGCHIGSNTDEEYIKVTEQKFLDEFDVFSPKRGDLVEVSSDSVNWCERVFLTNIEFSIYPIIFVCENDEKLFKHNRQFNFSSAKYMRKIELPVYTIKEAEDKFNIKIWKN